MSILNEIDKIVKENSVVLFMKGSPEAPNCGFSSIASQIVSSYISDYIAIDVLQSMELREGIKEYADWPTIPQLYINGEFVGGCDIIREMHESGELKELVNKIA